MKNVVLITLDATRRDVFGIYGNTRGLTPFIDSLKEQSIVFNACQSAGPYTQASFPAILCSGYYLDYGRPEGLDPKRKLISEALQEAGIYTAGFHSNPYCSSMLGWDRGWDTFYDSLDDDLEDERLSYMRGDFMNKKTADWLSKHVKTKDYQPFFLWLHYMDVHEPYMPERRYVDMVDPAISINQDKMYDLFENTLLKRDVSDPAKVSLLKRLYDVHVRETDTYVESFFHSMRDLGVLQDTAVIITSDHGDEFNEHGGLSHDDKMYAELVNVPLLIYGTGNSVKFDGVISNADISPTILKLFAIEIPQSFQGKSLLPLDKYVEESVFGEAINQKSVKGGDISKDVYYCRLGDMKLIYRADTGSSELYNLRQDPAEKNNLAGSSTEIAKLEAKLKPRIRRWANK
jgi:arylsulfatase A-like enzyme